MELIKDLKPEFDEIVECSVTRGAALLPILYKTQEKIGFLSEEALEEVAEYLEISRAAAFEVATFFTLFYKGEVGKNILLVCENISCYLVGAQSILRVLEKETGAEIGGNSPDGLFTIKAVSCLGACDKGPALLLNGKLYGNLTIDNVKKLVDDCRNHASH